jgi:sugar phosphate isomerase/epimerase
MSRRPFSVAALLTAALACSSSPRAATPRAPAAPATSATSATPSTTAAAPTAPTAGPASGIALAGDFAGPLGVQLYSFRTAFRTDVPGTLARVRALGFQEVELAGTYGMSAAQFRQALDAAGLRATSMHVGYERLRDSLPAVLAEAKTLGVGWVGTAWIPHPSGPLTVARAREVAADFDRWGKAARAEGVRFFYHDHGYEFYAQGDTLPMDVLMQGTDPEAVSYEMDVFWTALPGVDPAAWLRKYPNRWRLMHLKDMRRGVATGVHTGGSNPDSTEVPVGSGQIDYRAVLRAAKEIGVEKYYVEDEVVDPFASIPVSTRWLSSVKF